MFRKIVRITKGKEYMGEHDVLEAKMLEQAEFAFELKTLQKHPSNFAFNRLAKGCYDPIIQIG